MLAKASELVFVEALREHIAGLPPDTRNWVAGLRDAQVGAALRVIHQRFAEPWTMELLAHEVGMSRSSFADRFTSFAQVPPMGYLTRWRLQLAARLLQDGSEQCRAGGCGGRLPVRVGFQPRLQATGRRGAGRVAPPIARGLRRTRLGRRPVRDRATYVEPRDKSRNPNFQVTSPTH